MEENGSSQRRCNATKVSIPHLSLRGKHRSASREDRSVKSALFLCYKAVATSACIDVDKVKEGKTADLSKQNVVL
jgi:hypothetical protein